MKKFNYLFLCLLILLCSNLQAQQRNCAAMDYLEMQNAQDDKRGLKLEAIEKHTQSVLDNPTKSVTGVITIPVVVHVIYNTTAENISDAQILSQITVLNEDFRRTNSDANNTWSQAADTQIEFCLASVDPNGNATTGITRTSTTVTSFSTNDNMKKSSTGGKDPWPAGKYLNIWVCDIGGGILGYAQFPGGSTATDGVAVGYKYFGTVGQATAPFNLGRTTTHEVGHWLNLRHIWGDGGCNVDDFVTDTPSSDAANYGCATSHVSCNTVDMVQNYMDYSDDSCMNLFTAGQRDRMRALFAAGGSKASLLSSGGCGSGTTPPVATCSDGIQNGTETGVDCGGSCTACASTCTGTSVTVSITFDNYPEETSWKITNASGATVASGGTYATAADGSTFTQAVCLSSGCYNFTITDAYGDGICCSYGNGAFSVKNGSTTLVSGSTFAASSTTNFCVGSTTPVATCSDGIQNGTETGVDCGGTCAACNTGCSNVLVNSANFDSSWGIWTDGGTDCARVSSTTYASSGSYSIRLRDNTSSSVTTTSTLNLSAYDEVTVDFSFYTVSMETNEDFWLQVSTNGGSTYQTIVAWVSGTDFSNSVRYNESITITGTFGSNVKIRFRNDASADNDLVYIDDVKIYGCANAGREAGNATPEILAVTNNITEAQADVANRTQLIENTLKLYPVPTANELNIDLNLPVAEIVNVYITDLTGKVVSTQKVVAQEGLGTYTIQTDGFANGTYLLSVVGNNVQVSEKFVVIR